MEKDRFVNDYDKDHDGKLNPKELLGWVVPHNEGIAQEEVCIADCNVASLLRGLQFPLEFVRVISSPNCGWWILTTG